MVGGRAAGRAAGRKDAKNGALFVQKPATIEDSGEV